MESRFAFDTEGAYTLKTVFSIPRDDLYLLGLLNSSLVWQYLKSVCSVLGDADQRGRLTLQSIYVSTIPVPRASRADREAIADLAQQCLDVRGQGVRATDWEAEIDDRVAVLYGLKAAG